MIAKARCKPIGATSFFRFARLLLVEAWLVYAIALSATLLPAQELIRTSQGKLPIQSFRNPEVSFHLGPFEETLGASAGVEYTDNVNLTDTDKISDLSFYQRLTLNTTWTLSQLNQLQFNFGGTLTENFYGNGKSQINFAVSPDSMIQFQFAVSNFLIRIYDRFSYVQNPTTNPTATNTANLNNLTNIVGTAVDADLGLAILSMSADYTYNDQSGSNAAGVTNGATSGTRNSFRAGSSLKFSFSPEIFYGIDSTATRSTGSGSANVNSLSFGAFIRGSLTSIFDFDLTGGMNLVDTKPAVAPGYYFSADVRYLIDRNWQLLLSASHDLIFTTGTGVTEETIFKTGTQLNLTRYVTLTGHAYVNIGDTKTTTAAAIGNNGIQGKFTLYGADASVSWKLRKHWLSTLTYEFTRREADLAANTYIQNTISLGISYSF